MMEDSAGNTVIPMAECNLTALLYQEKEPSRRTLDVMIDSFTNENIHKPGNPLEIQNLFLKGRYYSTPFPTFYANGNNKTNKGYVSIVWDKYNGPSDRTGVGFKVVYYISVVDLEGDLRFKQSFSLELTDFTNSVPDFGFEKYVDRKTLLCQSDELLPQDTLTLRIELYWEILSDFPDIDVPMEYDLSFCFSKRSQKHVLILDSQLQKRLCEESIYFKRMPETPMEERETRRWRICEEEYPAFCNIGRIMLGMQYVIINNITDVCKMYIVADKYDIPVVKEICTHLFRKYICDGTVDQILDVYGKYNDAILKEILERFHEDFDYRNRQNERNSEWTDKSPYLDHLGSISDFDRKPKLDFYN